MRRLGNAQFSEDKTLNFTSLWLEDRAMVYLLIVIMLLYWPTNNNPHVVVTIHINCWHW